MIWFVAQSANLVQYMGSDAGVADAARVSYAGKSDRGKDVSLINRLAEKGHWTPFAHPQIQILLHTPVFVARQIMRTNAGIVWSEQSRRYTTKDLQFYFLSHESEKARMIFQDECLAQGDIYRMLLSSGCRAELARGVLGTMLMTKILATGSLYTWARMYADRAGHRTGKAQRETAELMEMVGRVVEPLFPVSWKALQERASD